MAILTRRTLVGAAAPALLTTLSPRPARAQRTVIRIGVLNDQSGPYRDDGGPTGAACVRQAVQDFGDHSSGGRSSGDGGFDVEVLVSFYSSQRSIPPRCVTETAHTVCLSNGPSRVAQSCIRRRCQ